MRRKHLLVLALVALLVFLAIPSIHLIRTKLQETDAKPTLSKGFTDDESHLNRTPIDTLVEVPNTPKAIVEQLRAVLHYAREKQLKVSIAGARHSMGGHTMTENGVVLNMLPYKQMELDTVNNILTIGSGALWEDALKYLDTYGKSVSVMQAFSSFSIGGSLSVNGHGWQKNVPPVSSSVLSFSLMLANGEVVHCSRTERSELFKAVLGGYGLFGVILDVQMQVVDNTSLEYKYIQMATDKYLDYYQKFVTENEQAVLVFGRLRISDKQFLEEATLNFFEKRNALPDRLSDPEESSLESKRLVFRGSVDSEYGKRLRWDLEKGANQLSKNNIYSRNEVLNDPVALIENKDTASTDILHEYFIPERHFYAFIQDLKPILQGSEMDLLNITIRRVETDTDTYLNYAQEPVYGFVLLFNQKKTNAQEKQMIQLTNALTNCALKHEGTFYLPYRLHLSKAQMRSAYPGADHFFELKRKYDPRELFSNKFYEHYK